MPEQNMSQMLCDKSIAFAEGKITLPNMVGELIPLMMLLDVRIAKLELQATKRENDGPIKHITKHDKIRIEAALNCDRTDRESLLDALRGLQSTDDPSLCDLHGELLYFLENLPNPNGTK